MTIFQRWDILNKLTFEREIVHWKINSAEFLSVDKNLLNKTMSFLWQKFGNEILKVSGTLKYEKLELTSSDRKVNKPSG